MDITAYVTHLLQPFFKWWWAAFTGVLTILGFFGAPDSLTISRLAFAAVLLWVLTGTFLTASVVVQGYGWYRLGQGPRVVSCAPSASTADPAVFQVKSSLALEPGQVMSVLRTTSHGTGCLGMVKVERRLGGLNYQCRPLWLAPIHKQALAEGRVHVAELSTTLLLNETDLLAYAEARSS